MEHSQLSVSDSSRRNVEMRLDCQAGWESFKSSGTCFTPPSKIITRFFCDQRFVIPGMVFLLVFSNRLINMASDVQGIPGNARCNMNNVGPVSWPYMLAQLLQVFSASALTGGAVTNLLSGPMHVPPEAHSYRTVNQILFRMLASPKQKSLAYRDRGKQLFHPTARDLLEVFSTNGLVRGALGAAPGAYGIALVLTAYIANLNPPDNTSPTCDTSEWGLDGMRMVSGICLIGFGFLCFFMSTVFNCSQPTSRGDSSDDSDDVYLLETVELNSEVRLVNPGEGATYSAMESNSPLYQSK